MAKKDKKAKAELVKDENEESLEGHNVNKGQYNEALAAMFVEHEELDENKKQISKAQRDIRAKAKEQFGIQSNVFNHMAKLRKLDKDVRTQFEHGIEDLKVMLGYQLAMELDEDQVTGDDPEEAANRLAH